MSSGDTEDETLTSRKHVADRFYEYASKGLSSAMESKVDDLPTLSLYMFFSSLIALGGRLRKLGQIELGVAEFMSWQRPAMTVSVLLAYAVLCHRPQWLVLLPLFLFVVTVLVPNYAAKFRLQQREELDIPEVLLDLPKDEEEVDDTQKRNLLVAMRQGQRSLAHLVELLDKFDQFRSGPAKFRDPKLSTLMLIAAVVALVSAAIGLVHVSVPAFFTLLGWAVVISKHPRITVAKKKLEKVQFKSSLDINEVLASLKKLARKHVIVDDPPIERVVEVFELQPQGLTPRQWNSLRAVYSSSMYTPETQLRLEKQLAPSVANIADVLPPEGWYFDSSSPWEQDTDAESWVSARQVSQVRLENEWAVDTDAGAESFSSLWRRRRWTRKCYFDYELS